MHFPTFSRICTIADFFLIQLVTSIFFLIHCQIVYYTPIQEVPTLFHRLIFCMPLTFLPRRSPENPLGCLLAQLSGWLDRTDFFFLYKWIAMGKREIWTDCKLCSVWNGSCFFCDKQNVKITYSSGKHWLKHRSGCSWNHKKDIIKSKCQWQSNIILDNKVQLHLKLFFTVRRHCATFDQNAEPAIGATFQVFIKKLNTFIRLNVIPFRWWEFKHSIFNDS